MNNTLEKVALNTQPIPPGVTFFSDVAKAAIARAWTLYEVQTGLTKGADNDGDWLPVNFIHKPGRQSLDAVGLSIHPSATPELVWPGTAGNRLTHSQRGIQSSGRGDRRSVHAGCVPRGGPAAAATRHAAQRRVTA
jgi:hypothetical protein